jgi:hypothetical protein
MIMERQIGKPGNRGGHGLFQDSTLYLLGMTMEDYEYLVTLTDTDRTIHFYLL